MLEQPVLERKCDTSGWTCEQVHERYEGSLARRDESA